MLVVAVSFPTLVNDAIEHVLRALPNVCIRDGRPLCSANTKHAANLSAVGRAPHALEAPKQLAIGHTSLVSLDRSGMFIPDTRRSSRE